MNRVQGSPVKISMVSTRPEKTRTEIEGDGLKAATAGKPAEICLKFYDTFGNPSQPGDWYKIGLSIAYATGGKEKRKVGDMEEHPNTMGRWAAQQSGIYTISYIASQAGAAELFVWFED